MGLDVNVIVGTYGTPDWVQLAHKRATPSAEAEVGEENVIHRHGRTLANARNEGAAIARSEWLCFLDADDELESGYMEAMEAATADLRGPAVRYIRPGDRAGRPKVWPACDLRNGNFLVIGTLVRRELFLEVGGFHEWDLYEDWCLWQRCARAGASVEIVPAAVYRAHVRRDSRNRAPGRPERERIHHEIRRANHPELYADAA